jgi:hypothetical protein
MLNVTKTQRMDASVVLEQRAKDHQRIAEQCADPLVKLQLERETLELEADARRVKLRRLL